MMPTDIWNQVIILGSSILLDNRFQWLFFLVNYDLCLMVSENCEYFFWDRFISSLLIKV